MRSKLLVWIFAVFTLIQLANALQVNIRPTAFTDNNAIGTNPANAYDNNFATFASFDLGTGANPGTLDYRVYTNLLSKTISKVNVTFDLAVAGTTDDMWGLQYSDNAGTNWYNLKALATGNQLRTNLTYSVIEQSAGEDGTWTFTEIQNDLRIRIQTDRIGGADGGTFYIYETWAAVNYTDNYPNVSLNSPANGIIFTATNNVTFNCSAADDYGLTNITFYWNYSGAWQANGTQALTGTYGSAAFTRNNLINGNYKWNCLAYDDGNKYDWGNNNYTFAVNYDNQPPAMQSIMPYNNSVDVDGNVYFNCSAADNINLKNISLYINNSLNQTISISGTNYNANFTLLNITDGNYNWYCKAYDDHGNSDTSNTRLFKVNTTAVPLYSNFTGNTTDWSNVPDITNVSNAVIDDPPTAMIRWYNNVNALDSDFNLNIIFDNNYVEVISENLDTSFNSSAEITIRNLTWDVPPLVYINGELCPPSICSNVSYSSGTAVFNVTHFTNFTTVGNSQLEIWDQTDPDKDNLTKYITEQVIFYANYTRKNNNQPILGAACTIDYADSAGNSMVYNATSSLYEYNRSFAASGIKDYNITCTAAGFQTITLSDSANISADNINPTAVLNNPADNYINDSSPLINITFNCSAADNLGLDNISLYITNSTNSSFSLNQSASLTGTSDSAQWILELGVGNYTWNCLAYDSSGNFDWGDNNRSIKLNYTIIIDNPPYWSNNQSNIAAAYSPITQSYFNITWQDDHGISNVWFESNYSGAPANYSMNLINGNSTNGTYNYSSILPAGTHYWRSHANDTNNQFNQTDNWTFTINKAGTTVNLSLNGVENNLTITYPQTITAVYSTNILTAAMYRNGSDVSLENNTPITLAAGYYNYTAINPGNQNYSSSSKTFFATVNKNTSTCSLIINPASPQTYPTAINASCSCTNPEASAALYRDGTNVSSENNQLLILPAGIYNYACNVSSTQNYTSAANSSTYTINKASTALNLTIAPSQSVINGTQTNASCSADNAEVSVNLYRNNTLVSNPDVQTLSPGTYNYTCNTTGSQNYTSASQSNILTVLAKIPSSCSLIINPASPQIYGTAINASCSCTNPEISAKLYRNGTDITSENGILVTLAAESYLYECNVSETANYTSATNSSTYIINKASTALNLTAIPSWTENYGTQTTINCSADNNEVTALLYRNGTLVSIPDIQTLAAGSYLYVCNNSAAQNYTANSTNNTLTINKIQTIVNLSLNGVENNITVTYPQTITAVYSTNILTASMYRNGSDVSLENNTPITLAAGYYNYTVINPGNQNYSSSSKTFFAAVNKTSSEINLLLNGNDSNITIELGDSVNHTVQLITPASGYAELYKDNNLIASGNVPLTNISSYNSTGIFNITAIYNETQNYTSSSEIHFINVEDNENPAITSTSISPYDPTIGNNVDLNVSATDNGVIYGKFANITLPNGTTQTISLPSSYTTVLAGRHNVTFFANDTSGNIDTEEDYFIAGSASVNVQFNIIDVNLTGIPVNLTIYFTGTNKQIGLLQFTGSQSDTRTNIFYDLEFLVLAGDIVIKLNNINLSLNTNETLGIDKNITSGYLVTYGINNTYTFTNAQITISYSGTSYTDENNLAVYKCDNWNFTARQCLSSWYKISAAQNNAADTFTFTTSSFSAFSIKQETAVTPPPAKGGASTKGVCSNNWICEEWSECTSEGIQIRDCTDMGTCNAGTITETRPCIYTYEETCGDNITNQDETDIDCGGICLPCQDGKNCITDNDCINKCNPNTNICYTPLKPVLIEVPTISYSIVHSIENILIQIKQNIKFLIALFVILTLITVILIEYYQRTKIETTNVLEDVAKKKTYGKIPTKDYIKNFLKKIKKEIIILQAKLIKKYKKFKKAKIGKKKTKR
ncbi:hypothetical protein KY343_05040 [Candidatus Woesearchaeota archaeon]|nr:hypothetical protein [Candidatus Woesearchaeota archaeon]